MTTSQPPRLSIPNALFRGSVTLAALALLGSAALAQDLKSYVYVENNAGKTEGTNAVYGFSNDGAGNLTALPGSPYSTGGSGVFDPGGGSTEFDAEQEVIANSAGTLLYAVNGHSNTIAGFSIATDGALTALPGSPYASGGQDPASIGILPTKGLVVVVNKNEDPNQDISADLPNYTSFTQNADGSLTLIPASTQELTVDCSPAQALIRSRGHLLFGLEFKAARLVSYRLNLNGTMTELSSVNPPTADDLFLGEVHHPSRRIIYVGLPGTSQVGVYKYTVGGILSLVGTVPNEGNAICWLAINSAGTRLYTAETEGGSISVYDTSVATAPVMLQRIVLSGTLGTVSNIALDPAENFLYALAGHTVHTVNILADGTMSETVAPVAFPGIGNEKPLGLAVVRK